MRPRPLSSNVATSGVNVMTGFSSRTRISTASPVQFTASTIGGLPCRTALVTVSDASSTASSSTDAPCSLQIASLRNSRACAADPGSDGKVIEDRAGHVTQDAPFLGWPTNGDGGRDLAERPEQPRLQQPDPPRTLRRPSLESVELPAANPQECRR